MPPRKSSKIERVCPVCSEPFLAWPKDVNRGQAIFCSRVCFGKSQNAPLAERFARHVGRANDVGCMLWLGKRDRKGYGKTKDDDGKDMFAHRAAYLIAYGSIPDGLCVLHDCPAGDYPACCNPEHLWIGTNSDNNRDAKAKGRNARGIHHGMAKLNEETVRTIRRQWIAGGVLQKQLATQHGVSNTTVSLIVRNEIWKEVK